jgi:alternate signal-mediated exported protein
MKNSTLIKGTAAIAVGAALLLGGGGTLANWNAEASVKPGVISAGDLNITTDNTKGVWTNGTSQIDINSYKIVPGDKLTFTQVLDVTLTGDRMAAKVSTAGITATNGFTGSNVIVSDPQLTVDGVAVPNILNASEKVTVSITLTFDAATAGRTDVTAKYNFNDIQFVLTQQPVA